MSNKKLIETFCMFEWYVKRLKSTSWSVSKLAAWLQHYWNTFWPQKAKMGKGGRLGPVLLFPGPLTVQAKEWTRRRLLAFKLKPHYVLVADLVRTCCKNWLCSSRHEKLANPLKIANVLSCGFSGIVLNINAITHILAMVPTICIL